MHANTIDAFTQPLGSASEGQLLQQVCGTWATVTSGSHWAKHMSRNSFQVDNYCRNRTAAVEAVEAARSWKADVGQ